MMQRCPPDSRSRARPWRTSNVGDAPFPSPGFTPWAMSLPALRAQDGKSHRGGSAKAISAAPLAICLTWTPYALPYLAGPAGPTARREVGRMLADPASGLGKAGSSRRLWVREGNDGRRFVRHSPLLFASPLPSSGAHEEWGETPLPWGGSALSSFGSPLPYAGFPFLRSVRTKSGRNGTKRGESRPTGGENRMKRGEWRGNRIVS
jgi:hypothetical protein